MTISNIEGLREPTILQSLEALREYVIENAKQGPQGEPGAQGPQGEPGAQGPQGEPGTNGTNGANAYQYNAIYYNTGVPLTTSTYNLPLSNFNITPNVNDKFEFYVQNTITGKLYITVLKVTAINGEYALCANDTNVSPIMLTGAGLNWRGEYTNDPSQDIFLNDAYSYQGSSFVAQKNNPSVPPSFTSTDWGVLSKGTTPQTMYSHAITIQLRDQNNDEKGVIGFEILTYKANPIGASLLEFAENIGQFFPLKLITTGRIIYPTTPIPSIRVLLEDSLFMTIEGYTIAPAGVVKNEFVVEYADYVQHSIYTEAINEIK